MIKALFLFTYFIGFTTLVFSQVPTPATILYNKGVEHYTAGEYTLADSLFSEAVNLYKWPDPYYNKAAMYYKMNDLKSFCLNLDLAADLGDKQARNKFNSKCTTRDTVYRNMDSVICSVEEAAFYEIIIASPLLNHLKYSKYVNDSMIIDYSIDNSDTTYIRLPNLEMPVFPGGETGLVKYLSENIRYPAHSRENGISGTIFATFVVDKDGKVKDVSILRGISIDANNEVLRIINNMPAWKPGSCNGNLLRVQFNLPVRFTLK